MKKEQSQQKDQSPLRFEDCIDTINEEIKKRRQKWGLKEVSSLDYDDVSQILRLHIYTKWNQWDQSRPLTNWINRIITNRTKNLVRDNFGNVAPPCVGKPQCVYNLGSNLCAFTASGVKCSECKLYAENDSPMR